MSPTHEFGQDEGDNGGDANFLRVGEEVELRHHRVPVKNEIESGDDQVCQRQAEEADVDPLAEPLPEEHGHVESVAHHPEQRHHGQEVRGHQRCYPHA